MKLSSRGIVLHSTKYSETSLVVKIYTEQAGMGSFIVGGVRSKKGKFSNSLFQPLTLVEMNASGKPGQTMLRITDIQLSPPFSGIPGDMIKSTIALFIAEVIYRSIREEEVNSALFNFLNNGIQFLDLSHHNCSRFHIFFMIQLSRHLGFYPNGTYSKNISYFDLREGLFRNDMPVHVDFFDRQQTGILHELMNRSFDNFHETVISGAVSKALLYGLVTYFELHQTQGHQIRSHKVLEDVLH